MFKLVLLVCFVSAIAAYDFKDSAFSKDFQQLFMMFLCGYL